MSEPIPWEGGIDVDPFLVTEPHYLDAENTTLSAWKRAGVPVGSMVTYWLLPDLEYRIDTLPSNFSKTVY